MTKPNINETVKLARKAKGLTQQDLAEEAGISLRTVQRIEKGTEEISGFSLKQISKVLDIPLEEIIMQNVNQVSIDSNQIGSVRKLYFSSLFFILNPLLGFLVPAIIGFTKQNKSDFYREHLRFILMLQGIQGLIIFFLIPIFLLILMSSTTPSNTTIYVSMDGNDLIDTVSSSNYSYVYLLLPVLLYYIINIYIILKRVIYVENLIVDDE